MRREGVKYDNDAISHMIDYLARWWGENSVSGLDPVHRGRIPC